MHCQPPLQSWGTFSLEKRGLIFLQRSTGRFSRGVSALLGRGGRAGRRAKCSGDREARSQGARAGWIGAARPAPRCAHTRGGTAVPRVSVAVASDRWPVPVGGGSYTAVPLSLGLGSLLSIRQPFSFLYIQAKKRKEKQSHENPALSSLVPYPRPLGDIERKPQSSHATVSACSASQSPVWGVLRGFVHLRKL